jgi:HK97 family phage portal protein
MKLALGFIPWPGEKRQLTDISDFTTFADVERGMRGGNTLAGVNITQDSAMSLSVVYRCVQINVETVSSLPVDVFAKRAEGREPYPVPKWLEEPNDEQDWGDLAAMGQYSYELDGNTFLLKASTEGGRLVGLYVLDPRRTTPKRARLGGRNVLTYEVTTDDQGVRIYPANAIIHMKGMVPPGSLRGLSPIGQLREACGVIGAAEAFGASFFGSGATLSGVIETGSNLTQEQADKLKEMFTKRHGGVSKSHAIGVLSGGAAWKPLSVKPDEAQFIETMRFNSVQIAHAFGIPPHWVVDTQGTKGYVTGVMAGRMDWHQIGLLPRLIRWERAISRELPRPAYIKFNVRGLLRGDAREQSTLMSSELQNAVRSRNEWRELLDLDPAEGGDTYFLNGGMVPLDADGKPDKPDPPPIVVAPPQPEEDTPDGEQPPADEEAPSEGD